MQKILTIILLIFGVVSVKATDTASVYCADTSNSSGQWVRELIKTDFNFNDSTISYPKAIKKLVNVYNWADRVFNSYDTAYVQGTGKNWKVMAKSHNWIENYMLMFSLSPRDMMSIRSDLFSDVGLHVSFMAVSVGYTAKLKSMFGGSGKDDRRNVNFNFTCSRIYANMDYTYTDGESTITRMGEYRDGIPYRFGGVCHRSLTAEAYYIFNYMKYSQAAAYCYSKYQLKSAGSWVCGLSLNHQTVNLDFTSLPQEMFQSLPQLRERYNFRYCDYGVLGGYIYNWVLSPKKWVMNFGLLPSMGYRHSYGNSSEGSKNMLSTNVRAMYGLTFNYNSFFASLSARYVGHFYYISHYAFVNGLGVVQLSAGVRF